MAIPFATQGCVHPSAIRDTSRRALERYKAEHYAAVPQVGGSAKRWSDYDRELLDRRFVLIGDVHDDASLHARVFELIRRSARTARRAGLRPRLFVEFLGVRDEPEVRDFLVGGLDIDELARSIRARWPNSWLHARDLDRYFYRRVLQVARNDGIELLALETIPRLPLSMRDSAMAQRLHALSRDDVVDLVLVGHAHLLGEGHLVDALGNRGDAALLILPNVDVRAAPTHPFVELSPRMFAWNR